MAAQCADRAACTAQAMHSRALPSEKEQLPCVSNSAAACLTAHARHGGARFGRCGRCIHAGQRLAGRREVEVVQLARLCSGQMVRQVGIMRATQHLEPGNHAARHAHSKNSMRRTGLQACCVQPYTRNGSATTYWGSLVRLPLPTRAPAETKAQVHEALEQQAS